MTVTMDDLTFGVEIETIGKTRGKVAAAIAKVVGGVVEPGNGHGYDTHTVIAEDGRKWLVMNDSSLCSVPRNLRAEVVTPILKYSDMRTLQAVVRGIRAAGAKVDGKCGMHIYIGAKPFDTKSLTSLVKMVYKQEDLITAALGVSEARKAFYTKDIEKSFVQKVEAMRPKTNDDMNELWYGHMNSNPTHYDNTRYHGLNLHNVWFRGTIEFRWFEGTLHAGVVKASVQFCLLLACKALNSKMTSSKKRVLDPTNAKYDFRVFLLRLGMIGDEFKTAREMLLKNLTGKASTKTMEVS